MPAPKKEHGAITTLHMKLRLISDIHLEFEPYIADFSGADVIVLAGDIGTGRMGLDWALALNASVPIIYVLGNHEYYKKVYPKLLNKLRDSAAGSHVHILENEYLDLDGVRFHGASLWTDFALFGDPRLAGFECQRKMSDYRFIRREPSYSKIRSLDIAVIHKKSLTWLDASLGASPAKANVVVTHHAPSLRSAPAQYRNDILTSAYASNLDDFVEKHQPNLWLHGHMHSSCDYMIGNSRVVCNPKGYPGELNPDFNPMLTLEVP